jgi:hypothetical protein
VAIPTLLYEPQTWCAPAHLRDLRALCVMLFF